MTRWKNGKKNLDSKGNLTGGCHFSNLQHACGDSSHLTESWGFRSGNEDLWEIVASSPFSPLPPAEASPLTCHSCMYFSWYPAKAELACRLQKIFVACTSQHILYDQYGMSVFRHWGTDLWLSHSSDQLWLLTGNVKPFSFYSEAK